MKLANRIAIVTGGGRGLGAVISKHLRDEGAYVVGAGHSWVDVTETGNVQTVVDALHDQVGPVDILINNAAILGPVGNIESNDLMQWRHAIEVNLLGAVNFTHACLPIMKARRHGKIINIVGGGATDPLPRRSAYACSKAALVRFTETVADEVQGFGIDVNAVAPGPMATHMLDAIIDAGPDKLGVREYAEHLRLRDEGGTPPELAAELCVYLASSDGDGVSGRTIAARWDEWPFSEPMKQRMRGSDLFTLRRVKEAVGDV